MTLLTDKACAEELARIYADLDEEIRSRGWSCEGCGDCCRFGKFGHMLYCTEIEAEYLIGEDLAREDFDEGECPYLENSRCIRREGRAIGCRIYHCKGATSDEMSELSEAYVKRLKALHERFGRSWRYAWLGEHVSCRKDWPSKG